MRYTCLIVSLLISSIIHAGTPVVVDATDDEPLSGVSVFGKDGVFIGISGKDGTLPYASANVYPLTLRCLGYRDAYNVLQTDSVIRLTESTFELTDVVVHTKKHQVLHIMAYVRDYSTLSTYSDTVTMFREKWVDFMVPITDTKGFCGWRSPRILSSKSYYHFKDCNGLDSVSDRFNQHFSWTDWVGIIDRVQIPMHLRESAIGTDTVYGKYSATETWRRRNDDIRLRVNVLADTLSQRWVPSLNPFFKSHLDFDKFIVNYDFRNVDTDDMVYARDLAGISCNIESRGRGRDMFMFNRRDEPFFVTTYSEIFIVDKSYITVSEAKKWSVKKFEESAAYTKAPSDIVPELSPEVAVLVDRVNNIDHDRIRLGIKLDKRYVSGPKVPLTPKQKVIRFLKSLVPISW